MSSIFELFSLQNQTAVVIGGTGELCGSIAEGFAMAGAEVVRADEVVSGAGAADGAGMGCEGTGSDRADSARGVSPGACSSRVGSACASSIRAGSAGAAGCSTVACTGCAKTGADSVKLI